MLLISLCLGFCFNLSSHDINSSEIVYFIEHRDIPNLIQTFNATEDISFEKAKSCLRDVFFTIKNQYPSSKELSAYKVKETLINYFRKELSDPYLLDQAETSISLLIDNLIELEKKEGANLGTNYLRLGTTIKSEIEEKSNNSQQIPSSIIIGVLETACGALLWLTPLRAVGTGLMIDGVSRMLDSTETIEKDAG